MSPMTEAGTVHGVRELAVHFAVIADQTGRAAPHWQQFAEAVDALRRGHVPTLSERFAAVLALRTDAASPVRVYFGNEFCEHRIPGHDEFEASCAAVARLNLPLTFVTPPVTDRGCDVLRARLGQLRHWWPEAEVVANDWGVVRLVRAEFPSLVCVLGRLHSKVLRDPRVVSMGGPDAEAAHPGIGGSPLIAPAYRDLLDRLRVARVELDNVPQVTNLGRDAFGLPASVYEPFTYVTTGRTCPLARLARQTSSGEAGFATWCGPCTQACRRLHLDCESPGPVPGGQTTGWVRGGNTIFWRQPEASRAAGARWAAATGSRLVHQPEIPC